MAALSYNTRQVEKLFDKLEAKPATVDQMLNDFCKDVVTSAKLRAPVSTGRLKWSIRFIKNKSGDYVIEVGVDYASFVEYGTVKMQAQPFLTPAINVHREKLIARIKRELEQP